MVSVCIEVGNETGSHTVAVRARNIERAVRIVAERYPGSRIKVEFPIDPETFFAEGAAREHLIPAEKSTERRAA
jgi:hypothetical protein